MKLPQPLIWSSLALVVFALTAIPSHVRPADAAPNLQDLSAGRQLFTNFGCTACHGERAEGLIGPTLAGTELSFQEALSQLRQPKQAMIPYAPNILSDAQVFDVYAYLRSLGGKSIPSSMDAVTDTAENSSPQE